MEVSNIRSLASYLNYFICSCQDASDPFLPTNNKSTNFQFSTTRVYLQEPINSENKSHVMQWQIDSLN